MPSLEDALAAVTTPDGFLVISPFMAALLMAAVGVVDEDMSADEEVDDE